MDTSSSSHATDADLDGDGDTDVDGDGDRACELDGGGRPRPAFGGGKFHRMVAAVAASEGAGGEGGSMVALLTVLCEALSFCTEDARSYFHTESTARSLVRLAAGGADTVTVASPTRCCSPCAPSPTSAMPCRAPPTPSSALSPSSPPCSRRGVFAPERQEHMLACTSLVAVKSLFELKVGTTIRGILVYEALKLAIQLIPSAARDVEDTHMVLAKEKIIVDEPGFLCRLSTEILPILIKSTLVQINTFAMDVLQL